MLGKRFTRRGLALALGAGLVLAGCSAAGPQEQATFAPVPEGEKVELTIWFGREQFIPDDKFASFEKEHPNIKVNVDVIPLEQQPTNFIRQIGSEGSPDVIQPDAGMVPGLAAQGLLYDVKPILDAWEKDDADLFDVMTPTAWDLASYDGVRHGLALHHSVQWNVYRSDTFAEVGVDVPKTWDEVLEVGKTIHEKTGMYPFGMTGSRERLPEWDINLFVQMGGQFKDNVMQVDTEAGRYWLNWYQRAVKEGVVNPDSIAFTFTDVIRNFTQGHSAMALISRNVYKNDIQPEISYGTQWRVNPEPIARPGAEADARYVTGGWPYLVSSQTKYPYEVGLLLRYLADDPQALSVALRYQPASNSRVMASEEYLSAVPWGRDLVEPWKDLMVRPHHLNQAAMYEVIRDAMQEALSNPDADTAEMATRYQKRLDELAAEVAG